MSFHIPEAYRITPDHHPTIGSWPDIGQNGAFQIASPEPGWTLYFIAADGTGDDAIGPLAEWEHVSVSVRQKNRVRIPTWKEMAFIKRLCWDDEDTVVQFHPRASEYVNIHPDVLHLWRWRSGAFPTPPVEAV